MANTINLCESPTLENLFYRLDDLQTSDRLGVVLSFIGDHGCEWKVSYVADRNDESTEWPVVTIIDCAGQEIDTLTLRLYATDDLEETVLDVGGALGY